jgi:hypothetical protein
MATGIIWNAIIYRDHIFQNAPCSLGSVLRNTALGIIFLDKLPQGEYQEHILIRKTLTMLQQ